TLYARWIKTHYTVTFNSNSGSDVAPQKVLNGSTVSQPPTPTRNGYTFAGWYRDAAFTGVWSFATDVINSDITLYAKWISNDATSYEVAFNSRGGSYIPPQRVEEGGRVSQPTNPTRNGYTFAGWYRDAELTTAWNFATDVVNANVTLYAKWISGDVVTYTVTFNSNGGSDVSSQQVAKGGKVLQPTDPTRDGYTFAGWYSNAALTSAWNFAANEVNGNVTLYARWESSTGIADGGSTEERSSLRVYPNPTTGELTVESEGAETLLYTLSGTLLERTLSRRLNLSSYPNGIYLLKAGSKTAKVVKQ
ncbi:MAG: InlB B-repeat-containing protein, partial [Prevotellaceae bacterium]|nr:InlB B-repeat-containing protein [Prevotellaceae bacterium]